MATPPLTVAAAPQQKVVVLGCCVDTGIPAVKKGAVPPAALGAAVCSLPDAPLQSGPQAGLGCQGLGRCGGGGCPEIPEGSKRFSVYHYEHEVVSLLAHNCQAP